MVANTTVELAQETLWDRLRDSPVVRPEDGGVRGRLAVGFAGFQRQIGDLHLSLAQEGLRRQRLPHGVDADGRQLPEPPFVRGDNAAWAMTRARTLAREMLQRAQRAGAAARQAVVCRCCADVPDVPLSATSREAPRRPEVREEATRGRGRLFT